MFDLLETFKTENGKIEHLDYHQARVNRSLLDIYQISEGFSLKEFFNQQTLPQEGIFRGRLLYEEEIKQFEISPYIAKEIKTFKFEESGELEYPYKWANRDYFKDVLNSNQKVNEIIFHHNGLISDCTIANLAFLKNGIWYTPASPLLEGTTRSRLLANQKIQELDIFTKEINQFERICLINVFRELSLENSLSLPDCIL